MPPGSREARRIAGGIVMVDEAEIELGLGPQLQLGERREIGVVRAPLGHRHMKELDRPRDAGDDGIGHLHHHARVFRLDQVLVGRAAVAQVVAKLDAHGHRVAHGREHIDGLGAEVDGPLFVIALPGQHLLAHVPLQRDAVMGHGAGDLLHLADEMLRQRRQQAGTVGRQHVVVGRGRRCRQADLELDVAGDDARLLQPVENGPRLDGHIGIAGLEGAGIGHGARLQAQAGYLPDQLAVPLGELERRHIRGHLDGRMLGQHVLQEADPRLADAGLAIGNANEMLAKRARKGAEHAFGIGQWNAADEVNDGLPAAICAHGCLHSPQGDRAMLANGGNASKPTRAAFTAAGGDTTAPSPPWPGRRRGRRRA